MLITILSSEKHKIPHIYDYKETNSLVPTFFVDKNEETNNINFL